MLLTDDTKVDTVEPGLPLVIAEVVFVDEDCPLALL